MYKYISIISMSIFLFACGGGGSVINNQSESLPQEVRKKIDGEPDNLNQYCKLQGKDNSAVVFADEVVIANCGESSSANGLVLDNLDYYHNIETLHLGNGNTYLGNIDFLTKLKKLRHLSIAGSFEASSEMWGQLNIVSLNLNESGNSATDFGFIENLASLKSFVYKNMEPSIDNQLRCGKALTDLTLVLANENIMSLDSSCNNIIKLSMKYSSINDISFLVNLKKLKALDLSFNNIVDLTPISSLTALEVLDLDSNQIADLTALSSLINLEVIDLDSNSIEDLSPLSFLLNLETLELDSNHIVDISHVFALTKLVNLDLSLNMINDISGLYNLSKLKVVDISGNNIQPSEITRLKENLATTEVIF